MYHLFFGIILIMCSADAFTIGVEQLPNSRAIITTPKWDCFGQVLCQMLEWWPWEKPITTTPANPIITLSLKWESHIVLKYIFKKSTQINDYSIQSHSRLDFDPYGRLWMKHSFCMLLLSRNERHDLVILTKWGIEPQSSIFLKFALIKLFAKRDTRKGTIPMSAHKVRITPLFLNSWFLKAFGRFEGQTPWFCRSIKSFNDSSVNIA